MEFQEYIDTLEHYLGVNPEVISFAINVNGLSLDTLQDVLFWATGYHTFDQLPKEGE